MTLSRSENMARIRGQNTSPEVALRKALSAAGVRYRLHVKTPGGKADIAIPSKRVALFIDGCFWHGCPEHYVKPRSSSPFWDAKLTENTSRDRRQTLKLDAEGWVALRVWEHELRENPAKVTARILDALATGRVRKTKSWRVVRVDWLDPEKVLERRFCEDLRNPEIRRVEERARSTKKVGRVRGKVSVSPP
jgi:DNA mismatch endonuclease, patch repair protein